MEKHFNKRTEDSDVDFRHFRLIAMQLGKSNVVILMCKQSDLDGFKPTDLLNFSESTSNSHTP